MGMINDTAKNFIKYLDINNNGTVEASEYKAYLFTQKMPVNMADKAISLFDKNKDGKLSEQELTDGYTLFDADLDGKMAFNEMLALQNQLSGINISTTATASQYSALFTKASTLFKSADTSKDNTIDLAEYQKVLEANKYDVNSAQNFIKFYDQNGDGSIDILEYQKKSVDLDANKDGSIDSTEGQPLLSQLRKLTNIELSAKSFISGIDGTRDAKGVITGQDGAVDYTEYLTYLTNNKMPQSMALNVMNLYDVNKDGKISYDEWLTASQSFDKDNDGALSFIEQISLQNSVSDLQFDTSINQKQYTNLFTTGKAFMAFDLDKDGEVSVEEYRAALLTPNAKGVTQPEYYAENLMMLFDQDQSATSPKDGKINLFEYMQGVMKFDKDGDGKLNAVESLNLKNELDNIKLFDNVNKIITKSDFNNDKIISKVEYKDYLVSEGMPAYLADEAIKQFDLDKDGSISRLELMHAYKQFDINNNNDLDINEKLSLYETLSKNAVNLNLNPANIKQYSTMFETLQNYVKENDNDNNSLINSTELRKYFEDKNIPNYIADEAVNLFDLNKDGNLDLLELMKMNLDYDNNTNGTLELNEELTLQGELASVNLKATVGNETQYDSLLSELKEALVKFDSDKEKTLNVTELKNYFASKGYPQELVAGLLSSYDYNKDNKMDLIELMKAYIDNDADKSGKLELNEELTLQGNMAGVNLNATPANEAQYSLIYNTIKNLVTEFDGTNNKQLDKNELKNYFTKNNLPSYLADKFLVQYDSNTNSNIDLLEWMKTYISFDVNKSGTLEFSEELAFNSQLAGINLNSNISNEKQYQALSNSTNQSIKAFDKTSDQQLNESELGDYFVKNGFSASLAKEAVNLYDANKDGSLDSIELLKANADFDSNQSGVLEINEVLAQNAKFAKINISSAASEATQNSGNFQTASNVIAGYDADKDNNLSKEEASVYFKALGLPQYIANNFMNLYDSNIDGKLNNLELMKGFIDADKNKSGTLGFDETINMYSNLSGTGINVTASNEAQITGLYKNAVSNMNYFDANGDKNLSSAEMGQYFKALGMPQYMADNFIAQYDTNKDGSVDTMELMKNYADIDQNQNGALEPEDWMKLTNQISGVNINITADNQAQMTGLYNNAVANMNAFDLNGDKKLTSAEMGVLFKALGMPQYMADNFIAQYDNNKDSSVDTMELMKSLVNIDQNQNGALEPEDWMKLKNQISGVNINITADNQAQMTGLYNNAIANMNAFDINGDKKLTSAEMGVFFKALGMPQYMADNFIAQYDNNKDSSVDTMELMKSLVNIDQNQNGALEPEDWMKLTNQISGVNINITADNQAQMTGLYNNAVANMNYFDANGDKKLTSAEMGVLFKALGMTQTMADNFIAQYDNNKDGSVDTMELMKSLVNIDQNQNGALESDEWAKLPE